MFISFVQIQFTYFARQILLYITSKKETKNLLKIELIQECFLVFDRCCVLDSQTKKSFEKSITCEQRHILKDNESEFSFSVEVVLFSLYL